MTENFKQPFSIIKHYNSPNSAVTLDGYTVKREEKVFIEGLGGFVPCAPYDNHFVYLEPSGKQGRWFAACTCGSPAVLIGAKDYAHLGSPEGMMLVCYFHTNPNMMRHADGSK